MTGQAQGARISRLSPRLMLTIGALGVVFGDIGTSPLYALKECFGGHHAISLAPQNVLGVLSLILWSLLIVVALKYILYVLRADNDGEGGVFALMALILRHQGENSSNRGGSIVMLGLFGAALLYGDGAITPAISVLSAVEGLSVGTNWFDPYIVPLTIVILTALFFVQSSGTGKIGSIFGPIMLLWFSTLGLLGIYGISMNPEVIRAVNPLYAFSFLFEHAGQGFLVLGAVFLAITGAEALYADLGHFGRRPIYTAWLYCVLPALVLNYFGQGALLIASPEAVDHPFYRLAPQWLLSPLIVLATAATVIASQAVISGAFSLTFQAVQLDYLPRLRLQHTSSHEAGQIYAPQVNWALFLTTVGLVLAFRSSSNLAAAYGIAVSTTMVITTILMYYVARRIWLWPKSAALAVTIVLVFIDLGFFAANAMKIAQGGWFPILFGMAILTIMATWHRGRQLLGVRFAELLVPFEAFMKNVDEKVRLRLPGTGIYMVRSLRNTPLALFHNIARHAVLHEHVLLVKVITERKPTVPDSARLEVLHLREGIWGVILHFGFNDVPDVPQALKQLPQHNVPFDAANSLYYIGRETVLATMRPGMALWREKLFAFLARNAQTATAFFLLPPAQVVEIGLQIDI